MRSPDLRWTMGRMTLKSLFPRWKSWLSFSFYISFTNTSHMYGISWQTAGRWSIVVTLLLLHLDPWWEKEVKEPSAIKTLLFISTFAGTPSEAIWQMASWITTTQITDMACILNQSKWHHSTECNVGCLLVAMLHSIQDINNPLSSVICCWDGGWGSDLLNRAHISAWWWAGSMSMRR